MTAHVSDLEPLPQQRERLEAEVLRQLNEHRGVALPPLEPALSSLQRQAIEAQARKLDEGKEYWRFKITVDRADVPAWALYGRPERQQARILQWLARRENVACWPGQHEQRAIGQPAPLAVNVTEAGSSILFELVGWRAKGVILRCLRADGTVAFEQGESVPSAADRLDSGSPPVAVEG